MKLETLQHGVFFNTRARVQDRTVDHETAILHGDRHSLELEQARQRPELGLLLVLRFRVAKSIEGTRK